MSKSLKTTGIVVLLFLVTVLFYKDTIIRLSAQKMGASLLGTELSIGGFSWNLLTGHVLVKNIKIGHPPGYEQGVFADIPRVELRYDWVAFVTGTLHMPLVRLDLKEMTVIRNSEGKLSVDEFKVLQDAQKDGSKNETKAESKAAPKFLIDELRLNVGQVVFKDYHKKAAPTVLVYDVDLKNKVITNIDSVPKLAAAVILQAVKKTAIQGAGMYAAAAVMGVGFLPGAVLGVVVADDDAVKDLDKSFGVVVAGCESFLKEKGTLTRSDRKNGVVRGKVDGVDIRIDIQKLSWFKTRVKVTARKLMLPKPEFAGGILYQIGEKLK